MGKKSGRPLKMTEDVINKLEYALSIGCTITEACLYADISVQTFYNYLDRHPSYKDRVDKLRDSAVLKARKTVVDSIESGDEVTAKWYLEKKRRDEFGNKTEVLVESTNTLSIESRSEALSAFLSRFNTSGGE